LLTCQAGNAGKGCTCIFTRRTLTGAKEIFSKLAPDDVVDVALSGVNVCNMRQLFPSILPQTFTNTGGKI
jgi:hypothetical protein